MVIDHFLLHRMIATKSFYRADGFTVELWQKQNASVQWTMTIGIGNHDRTGPAVAFVAPFLGARQITTVPEPVKQRHTRIGERQLYGLSIQKKRDFHAKTCHGTVQLA